MVSLVGGLYLGWALGANDGANVFGTAVASRIISFRKASIICALSIIAGAALQGKGGIHTLSGLTVQVTSTLIIVSVSAAITVTLMTIIKLPVSTSHAVVGSIVGIGLATRSMNWLGLEKVVICWLATPIGALAVALILFKATSAILNAIPMGILTRDSIIWSGLLLFGIYGSYALGANNVANATGIFSGQFENLSDFHLALIGGGAIAIGVLTYSKRVMISVGVGITTLDAFSAFIAVAAVSVTVHVFAAIGVPVSTSQAIVGAIIGIGFLHDIHNVNFQYIRNISIGWLLTPVMSLILSAAGYAIFS